VAICIPVLPSSQIDDRDGKETAIKARSHATRRAPCGEWLI
jgi:hypothetical protein